MSSCKEMLYMFLHFQLLTEAGTVFNGVPVTGVFFVDSTVGADTSMTVSYSEEVNITVTSPLGEDMTHDTHPEHFHFDQESGVTKIVLPGTAKVRLALRASLSGTFLQTLPDLVTPLKGHSIFISAQLSTDAVSALRKVWVLI